MSTCWKCGGIGTIVVCMDDLCRNSDHCMHGDSEEICSECNGQDDEYPEEDDDS